MSRIAMIEEMVELLDDFNMDFHFGDDDDDSPPEYDGPPAYLDFDSAAIILKVMNLIKADNNRSKDLELIIMFGHTRGFGLKNTNWGMIYDTTNPQGRKRLSEAVDSLGVLTGKQQDRKDALTVRRLMLSFPKVSWNIHCTLLKSGKDKKWVHYVGPLPSCLCYVGSPAIMSSEVWDMYSTDYCHFARLCFWSHSIQVITKFAKLEYESTALPSAHRVTLAMVEAMEKEIIALNAPK